MIDKEQESGKVEPAGAGKDTVYKGAADRQEAATIEAAELPSAEVLAQELARAEAQAAEYLDHWRRSAAEMSNARKRMLREQAEYNALAAARVIERLLPIMDDVDRAMAALPPDQADGEQESTLCIWATGFRLIQQKLRALLESEGVTAIPTEGRTFDPALHYAVTHEEQQGFGEGQIIAEVARGYKLGDRLLRPSMVRVAKGAADA